jgi:formylglycine-generating enzyme required for sulfatase activity
MVVLLLLFSWAAYEINGAIHVNAYLTADAKEIPELLRRLPSWSLWARSRLKSSATDDEKEDQQTRARIALVNQQQGDAYVDELIGALLVDEPAYVGPIRDALKGYQGTSYPTLRGMLRDPAVDLSKRFRAGLAVVVLDDPQHTWTPQDLKLLAQQLVDSNPVHLDILTGYLEPLHDQLLPYLEPMLSDSEITRNQQVNLASILAEYAKKDPACLARCISISNMEQYPILYPVLDRLKDEVAIEQLQRIMRQGPQGAMPQQDRLVLGKRRAGAAIGLLREGERESILDALRVGDDPEALTQFVHRCRARQIRPGALLECLAVADSSRQVKTGPARRIEDRVMFGLLLALAEYPLEDLSDDERTPLIDQLAAWYRDDPSSAIHGACGWLLRQWGQQELVRGVDETPLDYSPDREWFTLKITPSTSGIPGSGAKVQAFFMTFVVYPAGEYEIGSPEDELGREPGEGRRRVRIQTPFAVLDREITVAEYREFLDSLLAAHGASLPSSKQPDYPMPSVRWYHCVRFCRWLTKQAGLSESDQPYADPASADGSERDLKDEAIVDGLSWVPAPKNWPVDVRKNGFRLPMTTEWEIACRAGMCSKYGFGQDTELLKFYGWYADNSGRQLNLPKTLRPKLQGLFDMHGNVWEWCHNYMSDSEDEDFTGPATGGGRVNRGGSYNFGPQQCRSSDRDNCDPATSYNNLGFRVVLTLGPSPSKPASDLP